MAAPTGNRFWELRSKHGRDKLFASSGLLWEAACEYFKHVDDSLWFKVEQAKGSAKPEKNEAGSWSWPPNLIEIPTSRPYTLTGFLLYAGASEEWWREIKKADHKDFFGVINEIEAIVYTHKFEGAAIGAFNANIMTRDLGLRG